VVFTIESNGMAQRSRQTSVVILIDQIFIMEENIIVLKDKIMNTIKFHESGEVNCEFKKKIKTMTPR
jgi:hypothetical protein